MNEFMQQTLAGLPPHDRHLVREFRRLVVKAFAALSERDGGRRQGLRGAWRAGLNHVPSLTRTTLAHLYFTFGLKHEGVHPLGQYEPLKIATSRCSSTRAARYRITTPSALSTRGGWSKPSPRLACT
jgi:hypothetical protein